MVSVFRTSAVRQQIHVFLSPGRCEKKLTFQREGGPRIPRSRTLLAPRWVRQWLHVHRHQFLRERGTRILKSCLSCFSEQLAAFVVDNGIGMCNAGFACTDALRYVPFDLGRLVERRRLHSRCFSSRVSRGELVILYLSPPLFLTVMTAVRAWHGRVSALDGLQL